MRYTKDKIANLIIFFILSATVILGVYLFVYPPAIFPDPGWGFQVLRSMYSGGGYNQLVGPDRDDISQSYSEFITWWSPGQYLVPALFKSLFKLNYGQASALTVTFSEAIGVIGLYSFFKKIGFTPIIAALSLLFISSQVFYFIPYVFYNGGELLLFAFSGWFFWGCFSITKPGIKLITFVLFAGLIGFFCKASFMWIFASGICCMWIKLSNTQNSLWVWFKHALWTGIPFIASIAIIYFFYLSKGQNPASVGNGLKLTWQTFSFPIASPVIAGFSVDELAEGLIYHPGEVMLSPMVTMLVVLLSAVISLWLVYLIITKVPKPEYRLLIAVFYSVSILFFGYTFLKQAAITYEGRHFRLVGLIVVPGLFYLISQLKIAYKFVFAGVLVAIFCFAISYYNEGFNFNKDEGVHGPSGITQQFIDQPSLDYIVKLDQASTNAIFVFLSNDTGLEIQHNRIITFEPIGAYARPFLDNYTYKGHAGPVHVVLPIEYLNGKKIGVIKRCFPDYHKYEIKKLSDDFVLYSAF
jgi:hypothetical protein